MAEKLIRDAIIIVRVVRVHVRFKIVRVHVIFKIVKSPEKGSIFKCRAYVIRIAERGALRGRVQCISSQHQPQAAVAGAKSEEEEGTAGPAID